MSGETPVYVTDRHEMEYIPQGVSCTETEIAYYLRIRHNSTILTIRVDKGSLAITSANKETDAL
jgi:hypothetical protein